MSARSLSKSPSADDGARPPDRRRWWTQVVAIAGFYLVYTVIRDWRGTHPVSATHALANARAVIGFERQLGLFHEAQIQHAVLGHRWAVWLLDDWYGTTHFLVTAAVLIALFVLRPAQFPRWRNVLAVGTALALVGFAVFPLMPPRLLPSSYGFTDTLRVVGGAWNFESGPMPHLSDQFAAMPSLHFAWALWCGAALFAAFGRWWLRLLAVAYPMVTLVCVIVTANHYFTDTAAGALIMVVGYAAARAAEGVRRGAHRPVGVAGEGAYPALPSRHAAAMARGTRRAGPAVGRDDGGTGPAGLLPVDRPPTPERAAPTQGTPLWASTSSATREGEVT